MKILITIGLFLCITYQANAQGKGFNSPDNYIRYRQRYKDTLSIDLSKGKKIEFIYRWFDLFDEDEKKVDMNFWTPFDSNFELVKEKINELSFEDDTKYRVTLKTWRDESNYYNKLFELYKALPQDRYKNMSRKERKEHSRKIFDSLTNLCSPRKHSLAISERVKPSKHKEYQLDNKVLVSQMQWQHIVEIDYHHWKVKFYMNHLDELDTFNSINLKELIRSKQSGYMKKRLYKYHTNLSYKLVDGQLKPLRDFWTQRTKRTRHTSINFYPQVGTSLIKGKLSADMGALLGVNIHHKQHLATRLAARYQLKAFGQDNINGKQSIRYNGFLDALIDLNVGESYKREQWVGAGLGYLIHKEGLIYGEKTARVFLKYRSAKMWGIQPEFNYSFKENNGFVGLGFYFSL